MMMILSVMQKMLENSGIRARRCDQQPNFTHFQKENAISPRGI